jgi:hypothetical protein
MCLLVGTMAVSALSPSLSVLMPLLRDSLSCRWHVTNAELCRRFAETARHKKEGKQM